MTHTRITDFPELRRVFAGYLHQDFPAEYGAPAAALRAFREDASRAEYQRFVKEAKQFLASTATLDFSEVQTLVASLGCSWMPPSREALVELIAEASRSRGSGSRPIV